MSWSFHGDKIQQNLIRQIAKSKGKTSPFQELCPPLQSDTDVAPWRGEQSQVPETTEKFYTLMQLSAWEDFIEPLELLFSVAGYLTVSHI
jgi:hypothetical protein